MDSKTSMVDPYVDLKEVLASILVKDGVEGLLARLGGFNPWFISKEGRIVASNSQLQALVGYSKPELYGMDVTSLLLLGCEAGSNSAPCAGSVVTPAIGCATKSGEIIEVAIACSSIPVREGYYSVVCITDTAATGDDGHSVRREFPGLQRIYDKSPVVYFQCLAEPGYPVLYISSTVTRFGYTVDQFLKQKVNFESLLPPDEVPLAFEKMQALTSGNAIEKTHRFRLICLDGSIRWVECELTPLQREGGKIYAFEGYLQDISMDIQLQEQDCLLMQGSRLAHLGSWHMNVQSNELFWSEGAYSIFGVDRDFSPTLEGVLGFYEPDDALKIETAIDLCRRKGESWDLLLPMRRGDGELRWTRVVGEPKFENGEMVAIFGLIQDVTENQQVIRERERLDIIRSTIINGTTNFSGEAFCKSLIKYFAELTGAKCVFVGELRKPTHSVSTVAMWLDGESVGCIEYDLVDTPCANVVGRQVCIYKSGVAQLFPKDRQLALMGIESYVGAPLLDSEGEVLGLMVMMDDKPLEDEQLMESVFTLFSGRASAELERVVRKDDLVTALRQTVQVVVQTIEQRDPYTAGHQCRVAELSLLIAAELGLSEDQIEGLKLGASIHDIGKISIPAEILNRPGRLSGHEMDLVRTHAERGEEILKDIHFPWPVREMIGQHHERIDGSGYPRGLRGDEIILEARIVAVADVVEAITSHRPYRPAKGLEVAIEEIKTNRGKYYDPEVVDACLRVLEDKVFFP